MNMPKLLLFILLFSVLDAHAIAIPPKTQQLLVIVSENWETKYATLKRYEKKSNKWQQVGKSIEVIISRNGMAWGLGYTIPPKMQRVSNVRAMAKHPQDSLLWGMDLATVIFLLHFLTLPTTHEIFTASMMLAHDTTIKSSIVVPSSPITTRMSLCCCKATSTNTELR